MFTGPRIALPRQSGNGSPLPPRQTFFGQGGSIPLSALALANAGSFGLNTNAAELATSPSVPTGSSYNDVGQAGSVGNVTPQGQQPGYMLPFDNTIGGQASVREPGIRAFGTNFSPVVLIGIGVLAYLVLK